MTAVRGDPGIAQSLPPQPGGGGKTLIEAVPTSDPSSPQLGATIDRLRSELPSGALIGGPAAENHDLEAALAAKTPVVIGVVMALGFLLLLFAFQAPVAAAIGVFTNLLATGAAFGIAKWIFQDGHLAGLLGFQPQGFLDAWAPVFFFAMIFAISMDYTVFLLSSAKEHWDGEGDARQGDGRRARPLRARDLRRRRGDGGGLLHLRPLGSAAAEGDGRRSSASPCCWTPSWCGCCSCRCCCASRDRPPGMCRVGSIGSCRMFASDTARRRPHEVRPDLDGSADLNPRPPWYHFGTDCYVLSEALPAASANWDRHPSVRNIEESTGMAPVASDTYARGARRTGKQVTRWEHGGSKLGARVATVLGTCRIFHLGLGRSGT